MLVIEGLTPISADTLACRVRLDGRLVAWVVRVKRHEEGYVALEFDGMRPDDQIELADSDEYRPFLRALFSAVRGEAPRLPMTIAADAPEAAG